MGKKLLSLIIVLFAASIMIYSCGSDDGGSTQDFVDMTGLVGNVRPSGTASLCGIFTNVTGGNIAQNSSTNPTYIHGTIETDQGQMILSANVHLDKSWLIPETDHLNVDSGTIIFQGTTYNLGSTRLAMTVSGGVSPRIRSLKGSVPVTFPACPDGFTLDVTFTDI